MFVNPIVWKVAALITIEWVQFSRRQQAFLAKQNGEVMGRMSLFSVLGSAL